MTARTPGSPGPADGGIDGRVEATPPVAALRTDAVAPYMPFLLFVVGADGTIIWTAPGDGRVLGWSGDEVVGRPALDLVETADADRARHFLDTVVASGPGLHRPVELRVRHADGTNRTLRVFASNRLDDEAIAGIVVSAEDITERHRLEAELRASEERYRVLFSGITEPAMAVDLETRLILDANGPAAHLYGFGSVDELVGLDVLDLSVEPERTQAAFGVEAKPIERVTRTHRRRDGTEFLAEISFGRCEVAGRPTVVAVIRNATAQLERETALLAQSAEFRALVETTSEMIAVLEADWSWRWSNQRAFGLLGYRDLRIGSQLRHLIHPDDFERAAKAFFAFIDGTRPPTEPTTIRVLDEHGRWHIFESVAHNLLDDPAVHGIVVTSRDVTERHERDDLIRQLTGALENSRDFVLLADSSAVVTYANAHARDRLGIDEHVSLRDDYARYVPDATAQRLVEEVIPALERTGRWAGELRIYDRQRRELAVSATIALDAGASGDPGRVSFIGHDVTEIETARAQLQHQATHDALTGLPNRQLFEELGEQALARADRDGTTIAVLFLDLDRFKPVNDRLGHAAGDEVLAQVAQRLRAAVRAGDVVARFGGDEFLVLGEHLTDDAEAAELARRLVATLRSPFEIGVHDVSVSPSVGIATRPADGSAGIGMLIRNADAALLRAKHGGRGRIERYDDVLDAPGEARFPQR